MSRSGYADYCEFGDVWDHIRYRGAVKSAIRGKRGQVFLRDMLAALDVMPEKRLISGDFVFDGSQKGFARWVNPFEDVIIGGDVLVTGRGEQVRIGDVCALGCLGAERRLDLSDVDPHDPSTVASAFGIAESLAREIVDINDEAWTGRSMTPEDRFECVRAWVVRNIGD